MCFFTSKKVFIKGNKIPNKTKQEYEIQLADHLALGFNSTEPKLAEVLDTGLYYHRTSQRYSQWTNRHSS